MPSEHAPSRHADKAMHYYERFDARIRERLRLLITPEMIEEHRVNPLGFGGAPSHDL